MCELLTLPGCMFYSWYLVFFSSFCCCFCNMPHGCLYFPLKPTMNILSSADEKNNNNTPGYHSSNAVSFALSNFGVYSYGCSCFCCCCCCCLFIFFAPYRNCHPPKIGVKLPVLVQWTDSFEMLESSWQIVKTRRMSFSCWLFYSSSSSSSSKATTS
jgi:hypothetical protein